MQFCFVYILSGSTTPPVSIVDLLLPANMWNNSFDCLEGRVELTRGVAVIEKSAVVGLYRVLRLLLVICGD